MSPDLEDLLRWRAAGGTWRLEPDGMTVVLLTCDGGEEMGRINSDEQDFRDYVLSQTS